MKKIDLLIDVYSSFIQDVSREAQARQELSRALRLMAKQQTQLEQIRLSLGRPGIRIAQRRGVELGINRTILQIKKIAGPAISVTPRKALGITKCVDALLQVLPGDPDTVPYPPRPKKKEPKKTGR